LYDLTNTAIAGTGAYWNGLTPIEGLYPAQWISQVTPFTTAAEPIGFLDGPTGSTMRRLSLGPQNGMASSGGLVLAGCPSACVITVMTTYNPVSGQGNFGIAAGNKFSVTGTGTSLDTCGDGTESAGAQSPYTVASANSTGWASNAFACSISNGDYTNVNLSCGNNGSTYDAINGTQSCTRVSQLATAASTIWTQMLAYQIPQGFNSYPGYKFVFDGGNVYPSTGEFSLAAIAAMRLYVDPTAGSTSTCCSGSFWLGQVLYYVNNVERFSGSTFITNEAAGVASPNDQYVYDVGAMSLLYDAAQPYWNPSEKATFLNKMYNDVDDPTVTACRRSNPDASSPSNHNWVLAAGLAQSGTNDATHITLASSSHCHVGTVIALANAPYGVVSYSGYSYGLVTSCSGAVATVNNWANGPYVNQYPTLNNLVSATVNSVSGVTATGTTGQVCQFSVGGASTSNAVITVPLSGADTISIGATATVISAGLGYTSSPATASPGGSTSASCTGNIGINSTIGTPYTVFDTYTTSNSSNGATATLTFTVTNNLNTGGQVNVGDGVMAYDGWANDFHPDLGLSIVTAVGTNTLTAVNSLNPIATSTPQMAWRFPKWTSGDCGLIWAVKHGDGGGDISATPAVYPYATYGGQSMGSTSGPVPEGGNLGAGDPNSLLVMDIAAAADDSRAVRDAARNQSWLFDYWQRHYADYQGWQHSGGGYSLDGVIGQLELQMFEMSQSVPGYTTFNVQDPGFQTMFETLPDLINGYPTFMTWGGGGSYQYTYNTDVGIGIGLDRSFYYAPGGPPAGFLRNWMENAARPGSQPALNFWGANGIESDLAAQMFLHTDPRIPSVDYTTQPTQYVWNTSDASQCQSLTGWACNKYRGDMMISRGPWANLTSSFLSYDSRTYAGDYDSANAGSVRFYKASPLLGPDTSPTGQLWNLDPSVLSDALQFAGPQSSPGVEFNLSQTGGNEANITAWGSSNAGILGSQYGDAGSRYAYVCSNVAGAYNPSLAAIGHANRCVAHHKESGHDEFIVQVDDASVTSPVAISTHLHYLQTGQTVALSGATTSTGSTSCIDSSGTQVACSGLSTANYIKSVEYGGESSVNRPPSQTFGLLTSVHSPNTIYLHWDCPGSGNAPQCSNSPLSTYSGGQGWTDRVEIGAGASSGAAASSATWCIIHKVMQALSDTAITAVGIRPDSGWYGCGATGSRSSAVFLQSVGGATHSTMTGFTFSSSLPVDWVIGGLTPGTYAVTVAGSRVTGSPFTVAAGDTSIYFSTAGGGAVTLGVGSGNPQVASTSITGTGIIAGSATIH
jgi:hypothetical protein